VHTIGPHELQPTSLAVAVDNRPRPSFVGGVQRRVELLVVDEIFVSRVVVDLVQKHLEIETGLVVAKRDGNRRQSVAEIDRPKVSSRSLIRTADQDRVGAIRAIRMRHRRAGSQKVDLDEVGRTCEQFGALSDVGEAVPAELFA
jgi:hypothetical protein